MTSPQPVLPLPGDGDTPATGIAVPAADSDPNVGAFTVMGNTEDALQDAKIEPADEIGSAMAEEPAMIAAVAPMFDMGAIGGLELAQNGVVPALDNMFGATMDPFSLLPTTAQDLEALATMKPNDFDAGMVLNQLQQNRFGGMLMDNSLAQMPPVNLEPYLDPSPHIEEPLDTAVRGFAKLEFPDGEFYMNTYAVVLGRDEREYKRARKREKRAAQITQRMADYDFGQDSRTTKQIKREESQYSKSVVSEGGGIMRDGGDDPDPEKRQQRRLARKKSRMLSMMSKSDGYSSHSSSKPDSYPEPVRRVEYKAQTHLSKGYKYALPMTEEPVPVDPDSLRPDPQACPLIPLHPDNGDDSASHKSISREHLKIAFNSDTHVFEGYVIGRNGIFHGKDQEETPQHHVKGSTITLTSNCYLQIADVAFKFLLPDIPDGETGELVYGEEEAEQPRSYSEGGKEMSFDFENDLRPVDVNSDDSDDEVQVVRYVRPSPTRSLSVEEQVPDLQGRESEEEVDDEEEEGDEDVSPGQDQQQSLIDYEIQDIDPSLRSAAGALKTSPTVEKKRGPGRPPKDGIMSKREKQLVKKEAMAQAHSGGKAAATKTVPPPNTSLDAPALPVKNKVGRPRKHPLPEVPEEPRQKRKYTKRKPKEPKEGEAKEDVSGADNPTAPAKKEKPPKEPPEPALVLREEDYTEEQLSKPLANYVQLIFEALSNHPDGQMSLPQIYRAIAERYPWFYFKSATNGWQSSVRHNLGQNSVFVKVMREGKGWKWALVPGATIEKEKKPRRASPPPQAPHGQMQPIYTNPYHMMPGQAYHPHMMGPPGPYHYGPPPNMPPGQYPYIGPPPPHMGGPPHHPSPYAQIIGPPLGLPAIMPPQLAAPNAPSSYSSPYAPKPPAANESQLNGQRPPTEERRNSTLGPFDLGSAQSAPQGPSQAPSQGHSSNINQEPPQGPPHQAVPYNPSHGPPQVYPYAPPQYPPAGYPSGPSQNPYQGPQSHGHPPQPAPQPAIQGPQPQQPQVQPQSTPEQPQAAPQLSQANSQSTQQPQALAAPLANPAEEEEAPQPSGPLPNAATLKAVKQFKSIMLDAANSRLNVESIIDSATNLVLGYTHHSVLSGEDEKFENQIKQALINMLRKIPGANIAELLQETPVDPPKDQDKPQSQVTVPDTNQNETQASALPPPPPLQQPSISNGLERPATTIMRSLSNGHSQSNPSQSRPSISIPRPPMMGPSNNMKRASSGSPAPWVNAQSASPAKPSANGASTTVPTPSDHCGSQIAGQKRTIDQVVGSEEDDMRDLKRLSTSGPPQVKT